MLSYILVLLSWSIRALQAQVCDEFVNTSIGLLQALRGPGSTICINNNVVLADVDFQNPVTLPNNRQLTITANASTLSRPSIDVRMLSFIQMDASNSVTFDGVDLLHAYHATPNWVIADSSHPGALILKNLRWTGYWYDLSADDFLVRFAYEVGENAPFQAVRNGDGTLSVAVAGPFDAVFQNATSLEASGLTITVENVVMEGIAGAPVPDAPLDVDTFSDASLVCMQRADLGASYRGFANTTLSGRVCQSWGDQLPHRHTLSPFNLPSGGLWGNLCRNPASELAGPDRVGQVWCYTDDVADLLDVCAVPWCDQLTPSQIAAQAAEQRRLFKNNLLGLTAPAASPPPPPARRAPRTGGGSHSRLSSKLRGLAIGLTVGLFVALACLCAAFWVCYATRRFRRPLGHVKSLGRKEPDDAPPDVEEAAELPERARLLQTFAIEPETIVLKAHLDSGGSGSVFRGTYMDEDVAVKMMFVDPKVKDEGLNEILVGLVGVHPNCVRHFGYFRTLVQLKPIRDAQGKVMGHTPVFYDKQPAFNFLTPSNSRDELNQMMSQPMTEDPESHRTAPSSRASKTPTGGSISTYAASSKAGSHARKDDPLLFDATAIQQSIWGTATPDDGRLSRSPAPDAGQPPSGLLIGPSRKKRRPKLFGSLFNFKQQFNLGIGPSALQTSGSGGPGIAERVTSDGAAEPPRVAVCIVTELMDASLFHAMAKGRTEARLSPDPQAPALLGIPDLGISLSIAIQTAAGLNHLHQKHIHHGDLKALNILLREKFRSLVPIAKLCDFGTAHFRLAKPKGVIRVTAMFLAPEVQDTLKTSIEADIFAFGVTMWELCHPDWPTWPTPHAQPPGSHFLYPTPIVWAKLIARCCDPDPAARPSSQYVVQELTRIQERLGLRVPARSMTLDDWVLLAGRHEVVTGPVLGPYTAIAPEILEPWLRSRVLFTGGEGHSAAAAAIDEAERPRSTEARTSAIGAGGGSSDTLGAAAAPSHVYAVSSSHVQQPAAAAAYGFTTPLSAAVNANRTRKITVKLDSIFH